MSSSDYMMERIEDTLAGNSSSRDGLYSFFWKYFTEDSCFIHYLLGRGANGTLDIYYNYAHNDWLEIAVNQGLLGIFVYAFYWFGFLKTWKRAKISMRRLSSPYNLDILCQDYIFNVLWRHTYVSTSILGYAWEP